MFSTHPTFSTSAKTPAVKGKHWHTILARKWSCSLKRFTKKNTHTKSAFVFLKYLSGSILKGKKIFYIHTYANNAMHCTPVQRENTRIDSTTVFIKKAAPYPKNPHPPAQLIIIYILEYFLIKIVNL